MTDETIWVELVRIGDRVEAALLAAFLEDDGDIEFHRTEIGMMDPLFPRVTRPVIFSVPQEHLERAAELLEEYRRLIAENPPVAISDESGLAGDDEDEADDE